MPSFNTLHLHMLASGKITQAQLLVMYPYETSTTLTNAVAIHSLKG